MKHLHHFIQSTLHENKPDTVLILIGSNDIILSKQHNLNVKDVVEAFIGIGLHCKECGVKDIIIHSILVFVPNKDYSQVNDLLSE